MTTSVRPNSETGPFGPADGSRADLDEIQRDFVDFSGQPVVDDLASSPDDRSARLIVGKKGVGKTIYLKRFHANAHQEQSVYAPPRVQHDVPATEDVIRVCELYGRLAAEGWQWIWMPRDPALARLAPSGRAAAAGEARAGRRDALERDYGSILGAGAASAASTPRRARSRSRRRIADRLAASSGTPTGTTSRISSARSSPSCRRSASTSTRSTSSSATRRSTGCSARKGSATQVLELFRDTRFGNRLHVVVSVRDLVRSSLMSGEHATRFAGARHIRVLEWDHPTIRYFLHEKIQRLPRTTGCSPSSTGSRACWVARTSTTRREA